MAKLEKGMKMPNFKLDTVFGTEIVKDVTFEQLVNGKPTFFWFQRYIGCPPCRMDVHLLSVAHPEFVEKGANIVVVMQSKPEIVLRDMNGQTLPFHLVCDPTESLYKELEIGNWNMEDMQNMTEKEAERMKKISDIARDLKVGIENIYLISSETAYGKDIIVDRLYQFVDGE